MRGNPHLRGVIRRVYTTNPRKPNSANRKVVKVELTTKRFSISGIKNVPHNLKKFSKVWVAGYGFRDTPGVRTKLVIGKENFIFKGTLRSRRSIYGIKKV